jgi:hypothetical protein
MFKTGDIIVNNTGAFGHVLMCMGEEDDQGIGEVTFIHGTYSGNFSMGERTLVEEHNTNYWHFTAKTPDAAHKARLKEVALAISRSAKYGSYRALRLAIGSSEFGDGARTRLEKYKRRLREGGDKLVTTITCVEAVVLCYQLTLEATAAQFIQKDAAHTLPRTLARYLAESPSGWQTVKKPA